MRKRRIIIFAMFLAGASVASANPFIEADPSVQRGAALQLAKQFGGLRGSISEADIPLANIEPVDYTTTQSIGRAMTPAEWLRVQSGLPRQDNAVSLVEDKPATESNAKLPDAVPMDELRRNVRIVYINNAPL